MKSPLHLLHRAGQASAALFQRHVAGTLTPRQFAALAAIEAHEGASQSVLVGATSIDRSTLSDIIRRLARQGYVQRRRSRPDSRAWVVSLTECGRDLLKTSGPEVARIEHELLSCIPKLQRSRFLKSLDLISSSLEKRHERSSRLAQ